MALTLIQQTNFKSASAAAGFTFTPTAPTAAGHLLALVAAYRATTNNSAVITGITDAATGGSNTYHKAVSTNQASKSQCDIWYVDPVDAKSTTGLITLAFTADTYQVELTWYEVSGVANGPLDNVPTPTLGSSTSPSITSGTFAQANEFVVAGIEWDSSTNTESVAPASPWTNAAVQFNSTPNNATHSGYQIVAATTALTFNNTITTNAWKCVLASFKASAPSGLPTAFIARQARGRAVIW